MELRKVVFYTWERARGENHYEKVSAGHGLFHQFGTNYEEFENGAASYSTAIVELTTGEIKNIPVELVVFNN